MASSAAGTATGVTRPMARTVPSTGMNTVASPRSCWNSSLAYTVRGRYDGTFDKANLPEELILTNYFTVRDGKIVTLIVIRNTPASY